jgi:hypothetical protein
MFICAIETYVQIYYLCPLHMYIALGLYKTSYKLHGENYVEQFYFIFQLRFHL